MTITKLISKITLEFHLLLILSKHNRITNHQFTTKRYACMHRPSYHHISRSNSIESLKRSLICHICIHYLYIKIHSFSNMLTIIHMTCDLNLLTTKKHAHETIDLLTGCDHWSSTYIIHKENCRK